MKKHGFTLIELLIASTILSIVLLLATGAFASAASYNGKLREMRRASQDARKVATFISDDIRMANGRATIPDSSDRVVDTHIGEVALLQCNSSACWLDDSFFTSPNVLAFGANDAAQALLVLKEDENQAIIYQTRYDESGPGADASVYRIVKDSFSSSLSLEIGSSTWEEGSLTSTSMDTRVEFSGFAPPKRNRTAQPFVKINIQSKTRGNFDDIHPGQKAQFTLETLAETRDYNP